MLFIRIKSLLSSPLSLVVLFALLLVLAWDFSTRVFVGVPEYDGHVVDEGSIEQGNESLDLQIPPSLAGLLRQRADRLLALEAEAAEDSAEARLQEQVTSLSGSRELDGVRVKATAIFISLNGEKENFIALGSQQNIETGDIQPLRLSSGDTVGGYQVLHIDPRSVELYNPNSDKRLTLYVFSSSINGQPLFIPDSPL